MKNYLVLGLSICSIALLGSCKSQESAYRQAFNKAKAQQEAADKDAATTVTVTPATDNTQQVTVTPVTTTPVATSSNDADVRTINGGFTVISGDQLQTYSVVVGSFVTQANAEGLQETLKKSGHAARVVKTNETINGHTGWYRVIASSYADKASAVQSRNELQKTYGGAWLLYSK